jgi:hypothetical protein
MGLFPFISAIEVKRKICININFEMVLGVLRAWEVNVRTPPVHSIVQTKTNKQQPIFVTSLV